MNKSILILLALLLLPAPSHAFMEAMSSGVVSGGDTCSGNYDYDLQGASGTAASANMIRIEEVTIDCDGTIEDIVAWLDDVDGSTREVIFVLYDDDGTAGEPSTLLYNSSAPFYDAAASTFKEVTDSGISQSLTAGTYWVGVFFESAANFAYDTGVGQNRHITRSAFSVSDVPAVWPEGTDSHSTARVSVYMTF